MSIGFNCSSLQTLTDTIAHIISIATSVLVVTFSYMIATTTLLQQK